MAVAHPRRTLDRRAPWFPHHPAELRAMIENFATAPNCRSAVGVIAPHAGYVYSGECANLAYSSVEIPRTVLLLALDHRAQGELALWPGGPWETPLGDVPAAEHLIAALAATPGVTVDANGHPREHSGDNQVPFLKFYRPDVELAVINVGLSPFARGGADFADILTAGDTLAATVANFVARTGEPVLTVASSDLSHEGGTGNFERVLAQDADIRHAIENFDEADLFNAVTVRGATMCGSVPVILMMRIARELGATTIEVIDQRTSADVKGTPADYIVGYLSARVV